MKMPNKKILFWAGAGLLLLLLLLSGLRDAPQLVDTALAKREYFQLTIEEEGRTRLPDRYQVSAPVTGYLSRVMLEPGDAVAQGDLLFTVNPAQAVPLDARSRAQAEAQLARAEAALLAAHTQVEAESARTELAEAELQRIQTLVNAGHLPAENLDRSRAEFRRANAALQSARFAVDVARHERDNARALLHFTDTDNETNPVQIRSPINGLVLARQRQSEGSVQLGEAILTLGDLANLEVEVDVLSPDAVRLAPGMRVELERWGGEGKLPGRVRRVEPAGFTRYSALGVEEQRVWVIVDLDADPDQWSSLGDGYRVEARFIVWEDDDVLQVPASALFREEAVWALYVINNNRAQRREVTPGRRSGLRVEILAGLEQGERVLLHPGQNISEGSRVQWR